MNKVVLIYEEVPENTFIYLLDVSDEDLLWMKECHNNFVNTDMPDDEHEACEKLCLYLEGKEKQRHLEIPDITAYTFLILTGFIL